MKFVGRTYELAYLDRLYAQQIGTLCVVYGRRRGGKTRLLTQWLETGQLPGFYWVATDSSAADLLRSLSQMLYQQMHGISPAEPGFSYYDWDELYRCILPRKSPIPLIWSQARSATT